MSDRNGQSPPWLTYIVPTAGRPTLQQTLASIRGQSEPSQSEIICVGDTYGGQFADALGAVPDLCARYAARYVEFDGGVHCFGHPQRQYGMTLARGAWLAFSQDDNTLADGAIASIAASVARPPRCPRIFRVHTWQAGTVPREPELRLANCDADGLVVPNDPKRLGRWRLEYAGDYAFIRETADLYGGQVVFEDAVLAVGRPYRVFGSRR